MLHFCCASQQYADFDAYLGAFASKRRIKIRRERRSVTDPAEGGITMNVYRGAEISDELLRAMFDVYLTTIENNPYGRQYLNVDFFERLGGAFRQHLCFVTAERVRV
jgi:predicted N-acyltransferase